MYYIGGKNLQSLVLVINSLNRLMNMPKQDFYHVSLKAILKNAQGGVLILKADSQGTFAGSFMICQVGELMRKNF